nr:hemin uptake protein HemP [Frateuria defendens]
MPSTNATAVRRISSDSLLEGGRELVIQHQGGEYHLRLTRNDKLILTK